MATTVEFAVQISCDSCVSKIEQSLKDIDGIKKVTISKENGTVLVESDLPSSMIQEKIENTGRKAVLKGYGTEKEESEDIQFDLLEVDSSGCCTICRSSNDSSNDIQDGGASEEKKENENAKSNLPRKDKSKSDDEEELELKYSSDSEDGDFEARLHAFKTSEGEDIWKINEDESGLEVIDAEGNESENDDKNTSEDKTDDKDKANDSSDKLDPNDSQKSENEANKGRKRRNNTANKFLNGLTACKVRKGDFNVFNTNIALHVLILPEDEKFHIDESSAQTVKEKLVHELYAATQRVQANEPGAFIPRFCDFKLVTPGWLLINCDNKETFDWLLSWNCPIIEGQPLRAVAALDKKPLQKITFFVKSKWIPNEETMLKLIQLQNREIDTKRWVFEEKKPAPNGMEQYMFQVDFGTVKTLEKHNWSFFYELFAVKIIEYNGTPISVVKTKGLKSKSILH